MDGGDVFSGMSGYIPMSKESKHIQIPWNTEEYRLYFTFGQDDITPHLVWFKLILDVWIQDLTHVVLFCM